MEHPSSPSPPPSQLATLLSPSFSDSAIDMDSHSQDQDPHPRDIRLTTSNTSPPPTQQQHTTPLAERFATLASLISDPSTQSHLEQCDSDSNHSPTITIHKHLDHIERVLDLDPRRDITREITKQRPRSTSRPHPHLPPAHAPAPSSSQPMDSPSTTTTQDELPTLLSNLKSVTEQLQHRKQETLHLNALFTMKCEGMAQRIIALENEVHDLESDIFEDTIELEGLRGTVLGLESWVNRWKRQRESDSPPRTTKPTSSRKDRKKKKKGVSEAVGEYENDNDALIDGIDAWMRGWKDAEEGSRIRARMRKQRRELRRRRKGGVRRS
ncbi:hypothetical protein FQN54_004637 [Arachnomyces sp. PD_36]|nr:hypothetical protein FQN54_004637 [Arachnomyces sp. PD_36]